MTDRLGSFRDRFADRLDHLAGLAADTPGGRFTVLATALAVVATGSVTRCSVLLRFLV